MVILIGENDLRLTELSILVQFQLNLQLNTNGVQNYEICIVRVVVVFLIIDICHKLNRNAISTFHMPTSFVGSNE